MGDNPDVAAPLGGAVPKQDRRRQRAQNFRQKANQQTMQAFRKRLDANLFADYDGMLDYMQKLDVYVQNQSVPISITTRGAGLLLGQIYEKIKIEQPNLAFPLDAAYRATLAQIEAQVQAATSPTDVYSPTDELSRPQLPLSTLDVIKSHPANFSYITQSISGIGKTKVYDITYIPRFRNADNLRFLNIRLSNLRRYVEDMSNLQTPLEERSLGYMNNSIPGAIWQDVPQQRGRLVQGHGPIITNPDEIIPPNYDDEQLRVDMELFQSVLNTIARKKPGAKGTFSFNGEGNPSLLVSSGQNESCRVEARVTAGINNKRCLFFGDISQFYAPHPLQPQFFGLGILGLFGETARNAPDGTISPCDSARDRGRASSAVFKPRRTTVDAMLG